MIDYFAGDAMSANPNLGPRVPEDIEADATGHDPRTCPDCDCGPACTGTDCCRIVDLADEIEERRRCDGAMRTWGER